MVLSIVMTEPAKVKDDVSMRYKFANDTKFSNKRTLFLKAYTTESLKKMAVRSKSSKL